MPTDYYRNSTRRGSRRPADLRIRVESDHIENDRDVRQSLLDKEAYGFFRDEVKREDEIIDKRLTSTLTLQGFLIASVGVVISNGVSSDVPTFQSLIVTRKAILCVIILVGLASSFCSLAGVIASRLSLRRAKRDREDSLEREVVRPVPGYPQAHGQGFAFILGEIYPILTVTFFISFWVLMLFIYLHIVEPRPLSLLSGGEERRRAEQKKIEAIESKALSGSSGSKCAAPPLPGNRHPIPADPDSHPAPVHGSNLKPSFRPASKACKAIKPVESLPVDHQQPDQTEVSPEPVP